jgi:hypothetical protein
MAEPRHFHETGLGQLEFIHGDHLDPAFKIRVLLYQKKIFRNSSSERKNHELSGVVTHTLTLRII